MKQARRYRKIAVKQADIDAANARREEGGSTHRCCPVAQALAREAGGQLLSIHAGYGRVLVETFQGDVLLDGVPSLSLTQWMQLWDGREPVQPGTFWLNRMQEG